jgi:hypothetical protein
MEELDKILLEQLHAAKNGQKLINRLQKLLKNDKGLNDLKHQNKIRIDFFENMIENKQLLNQKSKKKKKKDSDLLSRNPIYEAYRYTILASMYGYTIMSSAMKDYWSFFRKTNDEKKDNH